MSTSKGKPIKGNGKAKAKSRKLHGILIVLMVAVVLLVEVTEPRVIGYTYDTGSTVWEMATRCCPNGMNMQKVVTEIEKTNGIENSTVYEGVQYKVPIYG